MRSISSLIRWPVTHTGVTQRKLSPYIGIAATGLGALASTAYGPEAALMILQPAGAAGTRVLLPIMIGVIALLIMLYLCYWQTIAAYPDNSGTYLVAKSTLGYWAGLLSAAALMLDYLLNVAVGISAGVAALSSAIPQLQPHTLKICLAILFLITLLNLRGTQEAGLIFTVPTYLFIASFLLISMIGFAHFLPQVHNLPALSPAADLGSAHNPLTSFLLLSAFATATTAVTGVEAISNSVKAFREPIIKNAQRTLSAIVLLLSVLLLSIAYLTQTLKLTAMEQAQPGYQSVLAQLTAAIVGHHWLYYVTLCSVLAILCLSANSSFVAFPRLCSLLAQDQLLPRAFALPGRRLIYSIGILFLAIFSSLLLIASNGITYALIPLFAAGAFLAFILAQASMAAHWLLCLRSPSSSQTPGGRKLLWSLYIMVNMVGACLISGLLVVILVQQFKQGAWLALIIIPALILLMHTVQRYYANLARQLHKQAPLDLSNLIPPLILIPSRRWDQLTDQALRFAMRLSPDVLVVHLHSLEDGEDQDTAQSLRQRWQVNVAEPARAAGLTPPKLLWLDAKHRNFITPWLQLIQSLQTQSPERPLMILIPELAKRHGWQYLLHIHHGWRLRRALRRQSGTHLTVAVANLPLHVNI